jgi:hypothetical protein
VGEFVDHYYFRSPFEDRIDIHLPEFCSAVTDFFARDDFKILSEGFGFHTPVCFEIPDDNIDSALLELASSREHCKGLTDSGSSTEVEDKISLFGLLNFFEEPFGLRF